MDETIPLNHLSMILTSSYSRLEGGQWFIRAPWARKNIRRDSKDSSTLLETSPSVITADLVLLWTVLPGFMDQMLVVWGITIKPFASCIWCRESFPEIISVSILGRHNKTRIIITMCMFWGLHYCSALALLHNLK